MNILFFYAVIAIGLFCIGLYALIMQAHLLRKLLAINIMGSGVFLLLISLSSRSEFMQDPVPHAMVITGIVVAVSATALGLVLMIKIALKTGKAEL
ncbi:MAG: NADH-quinone oxidoreductase subunit K [Sulfurimonas sp.]|nr:NADH-quinone oxidoreductase subunit K [Sulfurimonas sp.]